MTNKKRMSMRDMTLIWVLGVAGQICWNMENQWFNTYSYEYFGYDMGTNIITFMVIFSAIATTFSNFFFGTLSDRLGKRKPFIAIGYIIWGVFTFLFGLTHTLKAFLPVWLMITVVVFADSIMSFFGSMGNDSGFNSWTTDLMNDDNKKHIGIAYAALPVLGTIVGTVVGGILVSSLGYVWFFAIMGIMVSISGVIALFTVREGDVHEKKEGKFWKQFWSAFNFKKFFENKELVLVFSAMALYFIGFNCFFSYIGNIFIYYYGFDEANFGYLEGIGLVVSIALMIGFTSLIKKERNPLIIAISIISSMVGLAVLTIVSKAELYDPINLVSSNNIFLFIGIVIMGFGYVLFMQTIMVWGKELYPEEQRGQYEGIKVIFYVLIPMTFGSIFSKIMISAFGSLRDVNYTVNGAIETVQEKVPNELLFIASIALMALVFIPLAFVKKHYNERISAKNEKEQ